MTVGVVLLLYALGLGFRGPVLWSRAGWLDRAPRLGVAVLLAAAWSVLAALVLAGLTLAVPATALSGGLSDLLGACVLRLRAAYVTPGGAAVAGAGLTLSGVTTLRIGWATVQAVRERRGERRRQRLLARLAGHPVSGRPATVVDHPHPAAYCLAGRPPIVVVTSAAVDLLSPEQLDAVLAHEQAHLSARHHRRLSAAGIASLAMPELALFRGLPGEIRRLLEMHADELAARQHDPQVLATALVTVATAGLTTRPAAPSAALAAAGTDTVARIRRLLLPPRTLSRSRRAIARGAVSALIAVPLALALTPAAVAANQPPVARPTSTAVGTSPHR
jgi:Zn-dependent protease with chaperone function